MYRRIICCKQRLHCFRAFILAWKRSYDRWGSMKNGGIIFYLTIWKSWNGQMFISRTNKCPFQVPEVDKWKMVPFFSQIGSCQMTVLRWEKRIKTAQTLYAAYYTSILACMVAFCAIYVRTSAEMTDGVQLCSAHLMSRIADTWRVAECRSMLSERTWMIVHWLCCVGGAVGQFVKTFI